MSKTQYFLRVIRHNAYVAYFNVLAYAIGLIDKVEMAWFVFRGKGTVIDYHMSKLKDVDITRDQQLMLYLVVATITRALNLSEDDAHQIRGLFAGNWHIHFTVREVDFYWMDKVNAIKNGNDLFKALLFVSPLNMSQFIGALGLNVVSAMKKANIREMRIILKDHGFE